MQRSIRDFHAMEDALSGKGGNSIRNFFNEVHQPFLIFLYQSLQNYKNVLTKMQSSVTAFESNPSGMIRQDFLENEVMDGFEKVKSRTMELTDNANSIISSVSDLVTVDRIDDTEVLETVERGKKKVRSIVEELHTLDKTQVKAMESVRADLQTMRSYLSDMESKVERGDLTPTNFKIAPLLNMEVYSAMMGSIYGEDGWKLHGKLRRGENLTYDEREMLYDYLQSEVITDEVKADMEMLISIIAVDSDELEDRVNQKVLVSEKTLSNEIAMIQAYLYSGNSSPRENGLEPIDIGKLKAYLTILNNYKKSIAEVKKEYGNVVGGQGEPLLAEAVKLNHWQDSEPYAVFFETDIKINIEENVSSKEEFLDMENPLLIRLNESKVVYFMGGKADMSLQYINNENLKEEEATLTQEYVGNELFGLMTLGLGKWGIAFNQFKSHLEFVEKKAENARQREIGEAQLAASAIHLEVEIEERDLPYKSTEYNVHLAPSNSTYNILNKWEEVVEEHPAFPYPEVDDIKNRDWYAIGEFVSEYQDDMRKFNNSAYEYIFEITDD